MLDRDEATGDEATGDEATGDETTDDDASPRRVNLRTAVLGIGALASGYAVGRRLLGGGSAGDLRQRVGETLPGDGVDVPIVGSDRGAGGNEASGAGVDPSLEEVSYRTAEDDEQSTGTGEAAVDEDAVDARMEERTEEDAGAEPAEPGEMQVDEDVIEEAVDDEAETEE